MNPFLVGVLKNAILFWTFSFFVIHSANGEAVCNILTYGSREVCIEYFKIEWRVKKPIFYIFSKVDYAPVLKRTCCPGYGGFESDKCSPRCDLGCPKNSHCATPNECICDVGYVTNESHQFYGMEVMKSCKISGVSIAVLSIIGLCALALFAGIIYLTIKKKSCYTKAKPAEGVNLNNI